MSEVKVFNEILVHQIQGVMLHDDLANMFDFLGLKGFRCEQEYHALKEFEKMRDTCRYMLNHINVLPDGTGAGRYIDVIPPSWRSATRFDVSEGDRKNKVRDLMLKWHDWEKTTKALYEKKFKELCDYGNIASANRIAELIREVDCELKRVECRVLKLSATGWDMSTVISMQHDIKEKYKKKKEELR